MSDDDYLSLSYRRPKRRLNARRKLYRSNKNADEKFSTRRRQQEKKKASERRRQESEDEESRYQEEDDEGEEEEEEEIPIRKRSKKSRRIAYSEEDEDEEEDDESPPRKNTKKGGRRGGRKEKDLGKDDEYEKEDGEWPPTKKNTKKGGGRSGREEKALEEDDEDKNVEYEEEKRSKTREYGHQKRQGKITSHRDKQKKKKKKASARRSQGLEGDYLEEDDQNPRLRSNPAAFKTNRRHAESDEHLEEDEFDEQPQEKRKSKKCGRRAGSQKKDGEDVYETSGRRGTRKAKDLYEDDEDDDDEEYEDEKGSNNKDRSNKGCEQKEKSKRNQQNKKQNRRRQKSSNGQSSDPEDERFDSGIEKSQKPPSQTPMKKSRRDDDLDYSDDDEEQTQKGDRPRHSRILKSGEDAFVDQWIRNTAEIAHEISRLTPLEEDVSHQLFHLHHQKYYARKYDRVLQTFSRQDFDGLSEIEKVAYLQNLKSVFPTICGISTDESPEKPPQAETQNIEKSKPSEDPSPLPDRNFEILGPKRPTINIEDISSTCFCCYRHFSDWREWDHHMLLDECTIMPLDGEPREAEPRHLLDGIVDKLPETSSAFAPPYTSTPLHQQEPHQTSRGAKEAPLPLNEGCRRQIHEEPPLRQTEHKEGHNPSWLMDIMRSPDVEKETSFQFDQQMPSTSKAAETLARELLEGFQTDFVFSSPPDEEASNLNRTPEPRFADFHSYLKHVNIQEKKKKADERKQL